jgi:hypothetical protein
MMKKIKRILLALCVAAMLLSCMGAFAFAENDYVEYTVKGGDTVLNICASLKIDFFANEKWITEVNNIGNYNNIKAGKVLYLPTFDTTKDPTRAMHAKEDVKKLVTANETAAKAAAKAAATPTPVGTTGSGDPIVSYLISHKLETGETVASVCAKLGVDFDANADKIKKLSGITNYYHVPAGKVVVIPSLTVPTGSDYTAIVAHQVKGGETVGSICSSYKLEYAKVEAQLKALNNTENLNRISTGQTFYLPVSGGAASGTAATGGTTAANAGAAAGTNAAANTAGANVKTYKIGKQTSAHGSFQLQVGGKNITEAGAGNSVTIVATPDTGYKVYSVTVTKAGTEQALPVGNMVFIMPNYDVTVSVTFKAVG